MIDERRLFYNKVESDVILKIFIQSLDTYNDIPFLKAAFQKNYNSCYDIVSKFRLIDIVKNGQTFQLNSKGKYYTARYRGEK